MLDFGCGLGHLVPYLAEHFGPIDYQGVDMVPEFVAAARELHPKLASSWPPPPTTSTAASTS